MAFPASTEEPPAFILRLPNEIITQILHLVGHTSLTNASLVSKFFKRLTYPVLYRSIKKQFYLPSSDLFLRTLLANPDLGALVGSANLMTGSGCELESNPESSLVLQFLSLMPNITAVKFRVTPCNVDFPTRQRFAEFDSQTCLPRLHTMEIETLMDRNENHLELNWVMPVVMMTQRRLRTLVLRCSLAKYNALPGDLAFPNLTRLSYAKSEYHRASRTPTWKSLPQLVERCPSLKAFSCRFVGRYKKEFIPGPMLEIISQAIRKAHRTLETLVITSSFCRPDNMVTKQYAAAFMAKYEYLEREDKQFSPITSLKHMDKLKLLVLDQSAIWRRGGHPNARRHKHMLTDLLPASLCQLYLVSNPEWHPRIVESLDLTEELLELAEKASKPHGEFPCLYGVYISGFRLSSAAKVTTAFSKAGVTFLSEQITGGREWYDARYKGIHQMLEEFVVQDKTTGKDLIRVSA